MEEFEKKMEGEVEGTYNGMYRGFRGDLYEHARNLIRGPYEL